MAQIPVTIGGVTVLICNPEQAGCSHPGCAWPDEWICGYPVTRAGKKVPCGAKLCGRHASPSPGGDGVRLCQAHARLTERLSWESWSPRL